MHILARFIPFAALAALLTTTLVEAQVVPGTVTVYNGSGENPLGFTAPAGPFVGQSWSSFVVLGPDSIGSLLFASSSPMDRVDSYWPDGRPRAGGAFGRGELLCMPPIVQLGSSPDGQHSVRIPNNPNLAGRTFCAQAAVLRAPSDEEGRADVSLELQNALILTIGYYYPCTNPTCGG